MKKEEKKLPYNNIKIVIVLSALTIVISLAAHYIYQPASVTSVTSSVITHNFNDIKSRKPKKTSYAAIKNVNNNYTFIQTPLPEPITHELEGIPQQSNHHKKSTH